MRPSRAIEIGPYAHASSSISPSSFETRDAIRILLGSISTSPALLLTQIDPFGATAMPTTIPPPRVRRRKECSTFIGFVCRTIRPSLVPIHSRPRSHRSERVAFVGAPFAFVQMGENVSGACGDFGSNGAEERYKPLSAVLA